MLGGDRRIELTLFHDVLCAWSFLADCRLRWLVHSELKEQVVLRYKAFPTRQREALPSAWERKVLSNHYRRAAKTSEGRRMSPKLWTGQDPPLSTVPPLVAVEAAGRQGNVYKELLWNAMRQKALFSAVNVARRDVIIELAHRNGLDVPALLSAMDDPATEAKVLAEHAEAEAKSVDGVPALVVRPVDSYTSSPEWVIPGCRDLWEYRELVHRFQDRLAQEDPERLRH